MPDETAPYLTGGLISSFLSITEDLRHRGSRHLEIFQKAFSNLRSSFIPAPPLLGLLSGCLKYSLLSSLLIPSLAGICSSRSLWPGLTDVKGAAV